MPTKRCVQILLFVTLLGITMPVIYAQEGIDPPATGWSEGIPLIDRDEPDGHLPQIAVDQQGHVHVFWASWLGPDQDKPFSEAVNTIVYRRLDQEGWSPANDIVVAPGNGALLIGNVIVDDQGYLNLTWIDQGRSRSVFLSRAHVSLADKAPAWSTISLDSPQIAASFPQLITEGDGKFHLIYAKDNRSIIYLSSLDYGATWSIPVTIWEVVDPDQEAVANPRIAVDSKGYLHVVWTVAVSERSWQGAAVYYARSTDGGVTWNTDEIQRSLPTESTAAWINVAVRGDNEIHLAWNRGFGSLRGRYHNWSADNGKAWNDPVSFFPPNESGQTHWPWMVVDSAGILHLISKTGAGINDGAPKYMYWDGNNWSSMYAFTETQNDLDSALAIGLGNQLHFVHGASSGTGKLLYTTRVTGAPPIQAEPIPQLAQPLLPTPAIQETLVTGDNTKELHKPEIVSANFERTPVQPRGDNTITTIFIALIAAMLIVAPVLVVQLGTHRRSR